MQLCDQDLYMRVNSLSTDVYIVDTCLSGDAADLSTPVLLFRRMYESDLDARSMR
jgi:hypothetical protein